MGRKELWKEFVATRDTLTDRTNFFLIAEAMLLVAYTTLVAPKNKLYFLPLSFTIAGILLTLIWIMLAGRTRRNLLILNNTIRNDNVFPEYCAWREICNISNNINVGANTVIAFWIPGIILLLWFSILAYQIYRLC